MAASRRYYIFSIELREALFVWLLFPYAVGFAYRSFVAILWFVARALTGTATKLRNTAQFVCFLRRCVEKLQIPMHREKGKREQMSELVKNLIC